MTDNPQKRARNNEILRQLASGSTSASVATTYRLTMAQVLNIARKRINQLGLQVPLFDGKEPRVRDIHAKGPAIIDYMKAHPND